MNYVGYDEGQASVDLTFLEGNFDEDVCQHAIG